MVNIEEIASEDEDQQMQRNYVPRRSGRTGMLTNQELDIREEGLYRESGQNRVPHPMQPESEGNPSYFRENSSYYANSEKQMSRDSYNYEG